MQSAQEQLHSHLRDAPVLASPIATIGAPVEQLDVRTVLKVENSCNACFGICREVEMKPTRFSALPLQSRSNQVSGYSLRKTGIFAEPGGDFRRLERPKRLNGKVETGG
jgi:hypothetical protein